MKRGVDCVDIAKMGHPKFRNTGDYICKEVAWLCGRSFGARYSSEAKQTVVLDVPGDVTTLIYSLPILYSEIKEPPDERLDELAL